MDQKNQWILEFDLMAAKQVVLQAEQGMPIGFQVVV
jgi:hypothetical protein